MSSNILHPKEGANDKLSIRNLFAKMIELIQKLNPLSNAVDANSSAITTLQSDVSTLQGDVTTLQTDVSNLTPTYKKYIALLTQSGDGTDTQTSGTLTVGKRYAITTYVAGDDFSNVATVVSGTINTTGCEFIATGTTPTDYTNGSTLTDTAAPIATSLVNTLSGTPVWSYQSSGLYFLTLNNEFPNPDKIFTGLSDWSDVAGTFLPLSDGSSIVGYYTFYYGDVNKMQLYVVNDSFVATDLGSLIGTSNIPISFEVYP